MAIYLLIVDLSLCLVIIIYLMLDIEYHLINFGCLICYCYDCLTAVTSLGLLSASMGVCLI